MNDTVRGGSSSSKVEAIDYGLGEKEQVLKFSGFLGIARFFFYSLDCSRNAYTVCRYNYVGRRWFRISDI